MNCKNKTDHEMVSLFKAIVRTYGAGEYKDVISKVHAMVEEKTYTQEELDPFLYYLAAALDTEGAATDALPLFSEMLNRQASNITLASSVRITGHHIESLAGELYSKKPEAKELESFESVLLDLGIAPLWLRMHVAKRKIAEGNTAYAKELCENYLALSPNDGDYLRWALEMARLTSDAKWLKKLESHVRALRVKHPYRLDLAALITEHEGTKNAA